MRRGFMLVELLAALAILVSVSLALSVLFRALVSDLPRTCRVVHVNDTVQLALDRIREDVDQARSFPQSFGETSESERTILIDLPEETVAYELREDKLVRRTLTSDRKADSEISFSIPQARITWRVWRKDNKGYALEILTSVEQKLPGKKVTRLGNSHVFFVGSLSSTGVQE